MVAFPVDLRSDNDIYIYTRHRERNIWPDRSDFVKLSIPEILSYLAHSQTHWIGRYGGFCVIFTVPDMIEFSRACTGFGHFCSENQLLESRFSHSSRCPMPLALYTSRLHGTRDAHLKYRIDSSIWSWKSSWVKFGILESETRTKKWLWVELGFLYKLSQEFKNEFRFMQLQKEFELIICQQIVLM